MRLILITTTDEGETLTEKEVDVFKVYSRRSGNTTVEVPDSFSLNRFLEEAYNEELSRGNDR